MLQVEISLGTEIILFSIVTNLNEVNTVESIQTQIWFKDVLKIQYGSDASWWNKNIIVTVQPI